MYDLYLVTLLNESIPFISEYCKLEIVEKVIEINQSGNKEFHLVDEKKFF